MTQHIRRSQFVTTWGPGAILEGQEGPRIVPRPDIGLFYHGSGLKPQDYEIHNRRASSVLPPGSRIYRLPSNAELNESEKKAVYLTRPFPGWSQCTDHEILHRSDVQCPGCGAKGSPNVRATRFVAACLNGHLDDVDWNGVVKHVGGCKPGPWYRWLGEGGPLSQIEVVCPLCGGSANLGIAYSRDWKCSGRFPEREVPTAFRGNEKCPLAARVIQRQATHLRIAEVHSLFTIPPAYTQLHNLLQVREVQAALAVAPPKSLSDLQALLDRLVSVRLLPEATRNEVMLRDWPEIQQALRDVGTPASKGPDEAYNEELQGLIAASIHGIPPLAGPPPRSRILFEVKRSAIKRPVTGPGGHAFRIVPVNRLQVVLVQSGYRRQPVPDGEPGPKSAVVDCGFAEATDRWYPGAEMMGEGLFVMPDNDGAQLVLSSAARDGWRLAYPNGTPQQSPLFVWWHTLSHLVLRSLAVDSGYSAPSIRERVYVAGGVSGGMILYSVQPGADGTLGGLVSLAGSFDRILARARELAETCSNDPLCAGRKVSGGAHSGAACYACLLASETSCEHRNMWLDRQVLLSDPP